MSLHEDADMLFHTDLLKVGDSIVDVEGIDEGCDLPAEFNFSDFGHSEWMTGVTASAAASFESFHSGGDSGFSSPQDSPRDDWWATSAFVDASHDDVMAAHSRARLPSISLPHDLFAVTDTSALHMFDEDMHVAASVASEGSVVSLDHAIDNIHLFELDLHGPMVGNAAALSNKVCTRAVFLCCLCSIATCVVRSRRAWCVLELFLFVCRSRLLISRD